MLNGSLFQGRRVAVIGNYQPRQCGIATFTTDLCDALAAVAPSADIFALAMNDRAQGYDYPERVRFTIGERDLPGYHHAAEYINSSNPDVVCVQHEYGIFGGAAGSHILALLRGLRMPIVVTLHTVLQRPNMQQRRVIDELAQLADRLVVMSQRSVTFLEQIYHVPAEKIAFIPHGIPEITPAPAQYKAQLGLSEQPVLLTFGLLSANKGIEHVIQALPAIVEQHPDTRYLVVGATHPNVRRYDGEQYRLSLQRLARELGVERNVQFHNRFADLDELKTFIGATDIYITPYRNPEQSVSGTLSYVVGNGSVVVSTPYWYAEELLAEGRGVLVPFDAPGAIADNVVRLLNDPAERQAISARAFELGRVMIWPEIGQRYFELFEAVCQESHAATLPNLAVPGRLPALPALRLDHLRRMTDGTGMLQHATFAAPNYTEGYTTDDNARALIAATLIEHADTPEAGAPDLAMRYLAFLWHAFNAEQGRFRNFMRYDRSWLETIGSDDSHGRALWALGTVIGNTRRPELREAAIPLFQRALPAAEGLQYIRSRAFALLGLHDYLTYFGGDTAARRLCNQLADQLLEAYQTTSRPGWRWFEEYLSYDNARLPQALLLAGRLSGRDDLVDAGIESLAWLTELHYPGTEHFVPIGCDGFYQYGGERARFDQQPLEAQAMVAACLTAQQLTGDLAWHQFAHQTFAWFLGQNDAGLPLYDELTGGCRDGLKPGRLNHNQGAESTLAFLLSLLELRMSEQLIELSRNGD